MQRVEQFRGELYLPAAIYERLVDALITNFPVPICRFTGQVDRDHLKITLGLEAGVWPRVIYDDALDGRIGELRSPQPPIQ